MMVEVENKKTRRTYIISKHEWETIIANGDGKKYRFIGETKDLKHDLIQPPKEVADIIARKKVKAND